MSANQTPITAKAKKPKPIAAAIEATPVAPVQPNIEAQPIVEPTPIAEAIVEPAAEKGTEIMTTEQIADTFKTDMADKAQAAFADINARTKSAVEKTQKIAEDVAEFNKGNVEALVASGKIAAKGFETLGQDYADYGRRNFESATAALKSLAAAKTPTDFFKLQGEFAKSAVETMIAQASKNAEASLKLAGDVIQPLSNRVAVAAEKFKTAA